MGQAFRAIVANPVVRQVAAEVAVMIASEVVRVFGDAQRRTGRGRRAA